MLIEFRVSNYRSFRDEQVLSMVASADTSLSQNVVAVGETGRLRLLRSAVIYGANASGKSNLVRAINFAANFVRRSASRSPDRQIGFRPFLFDEASRAEPTRFEFAFIKDDVRYDYGFAVNSQEVLEERLTAYPNGLPQKWFVRHRSSAEGRAEVSFGSHLKGQRKSIRDATRPDMLFLSRAADLGQEQLIPVFDWFQRGLRVMSDKNEEDALIQTTSFRLRKDKELAQYLSNMLRYADFGIDGISVEDRLLKDAFPGLSDADREQFLAIMRGVPNFDEEKVMFPVVQMIHQANQLTVPLSLKDESRGTQRFFALALPWMYALKNGSLLVVDELDSSLHPTLTKELVALFHSEIQNSRNGQLIFNTHDTTLLDPTLFRRDQIWFVEKDRGGASHLYPLLDFRPRKDEALQRGYLQGRYGAIPFVEPPSQPLVLSGGGSDGLLED